MWWGWERSQRATWVKSLVGSTSIRAWLATSHTVVDQVLCLKGPARTKSDSSRPIAVVSFKRFESAASNAAP